MLGAVFIVAAVGKLFDLDGTRRTLGEFGLARGRSAAAIGLPLVELAIGVLMVPAATARVAAIVGLLTLVIFSAAIARQIRRGNEVQCHCFGRVHSAPVSWSLVMRNLAFAGVAAFIAIAGPGSSIADALAGADPWLVAAAAVAVLVIVLQGWFSWQLFEQHGRLIERVRVLEAAATEGGRAQTTAARGLPVGDPAPDFDLVDLDGQRRGLSGLLTGRVPLVLAFSEPDCGACEALKPQLADLQAAHADELDIVLVSRAGTDDGHAEHGVDGLTVLLQNEREVALRYGVSAVPSAAVVGLDGAIAGPLAIGPPAVEELIRNTAQPTVPVSLVKVAG